MASTSGKTTSIRDHRSFDGAVLPDGEMGELVFTSLTKEAFPIIRYRTRDLTRLLPGTARTMRRMEKITGRSDDMMILRGVNVFPTQIEEQLLKVGGLAPHFQIELVREDRLDGMVVHVEPATGHEAMKRGAGSDELCLRIKEVVGITVRVVVTDPEGVARASRARPAHRRQPAEGSLMARSRARDHDEKREAILHRAAIVFARDGYDRASMAGLAAEIGVSKALLYHYHASKEALLYDMSEATSSISWKRWRRPTMRGSTPKSVFSGSCPRCSMPIATPMPSTASSSKPCGFYPKRSRGR